jgi:hypothetical protein
VRECCGTTERLLGWACFVGVAGAAALLPRTASADLRAEASAVAQGLETDGALVARLEPSFLEAGGTVVVEPRKLLRSADACLTLIVLGARTTELSVVRADANESLDDVLAHLLGGRDARREDVAEGLYIHTACNTDSVSFDRAVIRMRSRRGAIEVLVARSMTPPPSLAALKSARSEGGSAPPSDAGGPLVPAPVDVRKAKVVAHDKAFGATQVIPVAMRSTPEGTGEFDLHIGAGCHAFDVLSASRDGLDLDADLRDGGTSARAMGAFLAVDRAEAPDAHLETCTAAISDVGLRFSGAGASTEVTVFDAVFAFPGWVTDRWGPRVAATWASLARRRSTTEPSLPPIAETLGAAGRASSILPVEPGRCYLAMVATWHGPTRGLRISASASPRSSVEESGVASDGASVVFCSEDQDTARVEIDAAPAARWWVLSVWPLGNGAP